MKIARGEKKAKAIPSKLLKPKSLKATSAVSKKKKDVLLKGFSEASKSDKQSEVKPQLTSPKGATPLKVKNNASPVISAENTGAISKKMKLASTPGKKSPVLTPSIKKKGTPAISKLKKESLLKGLQEAVASDGKSEVVSKLSTPKGATPLKGKKNASPAAADGANTISKKVKLDLQTGNNSLPSTPTIKNKGLLKGEVGTPLKGKIGTPLKGKIGTPLKEKIGTPLKEKIGTPLKEKFKTPLNEKVKTPLKRKVQTPSKEKIETPLKEKEVVAAKATLKENKPATLKNKKVAALKEKKEKKVATLKEQKGKKAAPLKQQNGTPPKQQKGAPPKQQNGAPAKQQNGAPAKQQKGAPPKQQNGAPAKQQKGAPSKQQNGAPQKLKKGAPGKQKNEASSKPLQENGEKVAPAAGKKSKKNRRKSQPRTILGAEEMAADSRFMKFSEAAAGVLKLIKLKKSHSKKNLFASDAAPIWLQIDTIKVAQTPPRTLRFALPNSLHGANSDICLIVGDIHKGRKRDTEQEEIVGHFKELLERMKIKNVKEVIPFSYLRSSYNQYELKRRFADTYDVFLCDSRISGHVMHFLGKIFFNRKSLTPVKLVREEGEKFEFIDDFTPVINSALHKTPMRIHSKGNSFSTLVGHSHQTFEQIAENVTAALKQIQEKFPGGLDNIRIASLRGELTVPVPIFVSTAAPNKVRVPVVQAPKPKHHKPVTGELSTRIGSDVTVFADGRIGVINTATKEDEEFEKSMGQLSRAKRRKLATQKTEEESADDDDENDDDDDENENDDENDDDENENDDDENDIDGDEDDDDDDEEDDDDDEDEDE